jgi:hypothetical protein
MSEITSEITGCRESGKFIGSLINKKEIES